ncbi:MAG: hypothetical protein MUE95_05005 [Cyclobacteriaceae bacterium]|jgi:hypothetical protein|nr:hypothetical protein [Cyclobacteriaceae bacterium]
MTETLIQLKTQLLTNWNFMRWLRLILGIYVSVQAIQHRDALAGLIAVFFLYQAFTNTGCFGAASCAVPSKPAQGKQPEDITYEEVK